MRLTVPLLALLASFAVACSPTSSATPGPSETEDPVRVGTGPEVEAEVLAGIVHGLLTTAGIDAEVVEFGSSPDAREAIELGDVEVLPSYTGAVWLDELEWADPPGDPVSSFERVKLADERRGLLWLEPTAVNATFAFVVQGPPARTATLEDLDDLATVLNAAAEDASAGGTAPPTTLCVDGDFATRPDGLPAVARLYALRDDVLRNQVVAADPADVVEAIQSEQCLAGLTTATDGEAWAAGMRPLVDRQRAFPAFVVAPLVTEELRDARPEVVTALEPFQALTTEQVAALNARVLLGEPIAAVVADAVAALLGGPGRTQAAG